MYVGWEQVLGDRDLERLLDDPSTVFVQLWGSPRSFEVQIPGEAKNVKGKSLDVFKPNISKLGSINVRHHYVAAVSYIMIWLIENTF